MQKMSSPAVEPKFYHYCYVCNTQLNSCKQALLHCSGKRHRKKLQFLQIRQHSVGHAVSSVIGNGLVGSGGPGHSPACNGESFNNNPYYAPVYGAGPPPVQFLPPIHPIQQQQQQPERHFYPNAMSPAAMAGTEQWLRPIYQTQLPPPTMGRPLNFPAPNGGPYIALPPSVLHSRFSTPRSSPILSTDVSGGTSSSSEGLRSAVISPSETSSLSSDQSGSLRCYRCHVCQQYYNSLAQLHAHLDSAKHYRHQNKTPSRVNNVDTEGTTVYYCSKCSLTLSSLADLRAHNESAEHREKSSMHDDDSRCSSCNVLINSTHEELLSELTLNSTNDNKEKRKETDLIIRRASSAALRTKPAAFFHQTNSL